jgi:hypothetical protein
LQARCLACDLVGGFKGEGCPLHVCIFSYAAIKTRSREPTPRRKTRCWPGNCTTRTPEVRTEYHSFLVLSYLFWCVWHLRSYSRPEPKIETAAEGQFGGFIGRAYASHHKLNLDWTPDVSRSYQTVSGACPLRSSQPHFP